MIEDRQPTKTLHFVIQGRDRGKIEGLISEVQEEFGIERPSFPTLNGSIVTEPPQQNLTVTVHFQELLSQERVNEFYSRLQGRGITIMIPRMKQ